MRKRKQKKAKQPEVVRDCLSGELILVSEAHQVWEFSGAGVVKEKGFTTRNVREIHQVAYGHTFYKDTRIVDVDEMGRCVELQRANKTIEFLNKENSDAWAKAGERLGELKELQDKLDSYRVFRASLLILAVGYGLIQITILATNWYLVS